MARFPSVLLAVLMNMCSGRKVHRTARIALRTTPAQRRRCYGRGSQQSHANLRGINAGAHYGQLPMWLSDDATTTSSPGRPMGVKATCTAFTVRPLSGVVSAICSLRTSFTAPTLVVVFGATCVGAEITTSLPIARKPMVVMPVDAAHVDVDVDVTARRVIVGRPRPLRAASVFRYRAPFTQDRLVLPDLLFAWESIVGQGSASVPKIASVSEALDVDRPGNPTVVTLAQRPLAVAGPLAEPASVATHGVDVVDEDVVEMRPVSGVGPMMMSGGPRRAVSPADRA